MPRLRHSSNAERQPARLISTPRGGTTVSTTVAGAKFSDQTAALLDWAEAQDGWRVEPDARGAGRAKANSVVVYPADKDEHPVTVNERGAKFNRAHYENLRRQLYAAGLPVLPADQARGEVAVDAHIAGTAETEPVGAVGLSELFEAAQHVEPRIKSGELPRLNDAEVQNLLDDEKSRAPAVATIVDGLCRTAGVGNIEADLMASLAHTFMGWAARHGADRLEAATEQIEARIRADLEKDIAEALRMGEEAYEARDRAIAATEKAEAREAQARTDCAAALERARVAEAAAAEAERVLGPLRTLLGKTVS